MTASTSDLYEVYPALRQVETGIDHRLDERSLLEAYIPKNTVGVELDVFTGLFSERLFEIAQPRKFFMVDPWWKAHGEFYPDWGPYTAYGKLATKGAHDAANARMHRALGSGAAKIEVATSTEWLAQQPNGFLDWAYVDADHSYKGTLEELRLLKNKVKPNGIILGDDWDGEPTSHFFGVAKAVNEFLKESEFSIVMAGTSKQWAIRRPSMGRAAKSKLRRVGKNLNLWRHLPR